MNITEFRQKFPEYDDMDDTTVANNLYERYYKDMPRNQFMIRFMGKPQESKTSTKEYLKEAVSNIPRSALEFGKGAVMSLATFPGFGPMGTASVQAMPGPLDTIKGMYDYARERYGGIDKALETFKTDPVGFMADLTAVAGAAGLGGAKVLSKVKPSPVNLSKQIGTTVEKGITKGIRPSVSGKTTLKGSKNYFTNAQEAVENIIQNKGNLSLTDDVGNVVTGKLPENLSQFQQAIDQTKRNIFKQYDALAKQAGQSGAMVDLGGAASEVSKIADNKVIQNFAPDVAKYASDRASTVATQAYTAEQAQDAIKIMNQSLEAFYKNPSYDTASRAYVDSVIVNNMRNSLDDVITKAAGPGYKDLKKSYGALKSIEKDVGHRAIIDARKNVKGLIDFSDILSGGSAIQGIISMNPALVGKGAAMAAIKNLLKIQNDPNRIIKNMFARTEKLMNKRSQLTRRPPVVMEDIPSRRTYTPEQSELARRQYETRTLPFPEE